MFNYLNGIQYSGGSVAKLISPLYFFAWSVNRTKEARSPSSSGLSSFQRMSTPHFPPISYKRDATPLIETVDHQIVQSPQPATMNTKSCLVLALLLVAVSLPEGQAGYSIYYVNYAKK